MKCLIRLATAADAKPLTDLINHAYRGEGGWTTEMDLVGGQRASLSDVTSWLQEQEQEGETSKQPIFVAVEDHCDFTSGKDSPTTAGDHSSSTPSLSSSACTTHQRAPLLGCVQPARAGHQGNIQEQEGIAILSLFAVAPQYQSQGIGKALIHHALNHMREAWHCTKCIITVIEVRHDIIRWYEKLGFTWDGVTTKPFVLPELAKKQFLFRVMEKIL